MARCVEPGVMVLTQKERKVGIDDIVLSGRAAGSGAHGTGI
jgi:hypothetical protein